MWMNPFRFLSLWVVSGVALCGDQTPVPSEPAVAEPAPLVAAPETPVVVEAETPPAPTPTPPKKKNSPTRSKSRGPSQSVVVYNHDGLLPAGQEAEAVVSIGGSSTALGNVHGAVVSIMGDSMAEGTVSDSVVSIFGNTKVRGRAGVAVAVLGGVELGPDANVEEVVSIGGPVVRAPGSVVRGQTVEIAFLRDLPDFSGFRSWVRHAFFLGRPLAIAEHLGWAWAIAGCFLAFYLLLAMAFPRGFQRCVQTLDTRPGRTIGVSVLCLVLTPILTIVLAVTVVGPVVAVVTIGLATLFGKATLLAWMGRKLVFGVPEDSRLHVMLSVLVGGVLLAALYLIPVVGFVVWKLTGVLGLGMAVYTLLLSSRRDSPKKVASPVWTPPAVAPESPTGSLGYLAPTFPTLEPAAVGASGASGGLESGMAPPPVPRPLAAYPRAGFWIRAGALAIDAVVVGVISAFLSLGSGFLLLLAVYGAVMWKLRGTTVGGLVCGLRLVRADDRPMDWATAIVRALGCFLSLFVAGLGFIWVAIDDEKQAWHDKIAGTVVIAGVRHSSLV